jgi:hypothetical protein
VNWKGCEKKESIYGIIYELVKHSSEETKEKQEQTPSG